MGTTPNELVMRLRALADPCIRRGYVARHLAEAEVEPLAMLLGYLVLNAGHEDVRAAWLDVALALLPAEGPVTIGTAAIVVERLQAHPARGVLGFLAIDPGERRGPDVIGDAYELEDVALGLRKAKARLRHRDLLRQMTADPDPSVIRILLENPMVGESEAIRVASLRPQSAATFLEVLSSVRFGVREAVQAAIALNPWCPVRVGLAVLPMLSIAHLQQVAEATTLDPRVCEAARVLPAIRRRG